MFQQGEQHEKTAYRLGCLRAFRRCAPSAEDVKLGILIGFTGPIESLTATMAAAAEMAMEEANASGKLLDGSTVTAVRADSTCIDAAAATAAAERLITADKVSRASSAATARA